MVELKFEERPAELHERFDTYNQTWVRSLGAGAVLLPPDDKHETPFIVFTPRGTLDTVAAECPRLATLGPEGATLGLEDRVDASCVPMAIRRVFTEGRTVGTGARLILGERGVLKEHFDRRGLHAMTTLFIRTERPCIQDHA